MKYLIALLFVLTLRISTSEATHIVGGGFSYRQIQPNTLRFTLTLYFDYLNGSVGAKDRAARCYVFQKSNNRLMDSVLLVLVDSSRFLPFTNPNCGLKANIRTQILEYSGNLNAFSSRYNSANGYYIIWERCCRNDIITNIVEPGATGQTFYMEFPPVVLNGQPYRNNSPVFEVINSDYPCIGENFELSFGATDQDVSPKDSLVFSLTSPLKGNSLTTQPAGVPPIPGPYSVVVWRPGFNAFYPLAGNPGLQVNPRTGLLTCRATQTGLYVFSVKCEEFRNGRKIGEIRREMQINVVDCQPNAKPSIVLQADGSSNPGQRLVDNDTLYLTSSLRPNCQTIRLVDKERNEPIRFELVRISGNAPASLSTLRNLFIGSSSDTVVSSFCVPACSFASPEDPWKVLFVATDNGCSKPKSDSLFLYFVVRPEPSSPPTLQTLNPQPDTIEVFQTSTVNIPMVGNQAQGVKLTFKSTLTDLVGNRIESGNMLFPSNQGFGIVNGLFYWQEICVFPEFQPLILTTILVSDACGDIKYDTLVQYIRIKPKSLVVKLESSFEGVPPISLKEQESTSFVLNAIVNDDRNVTLTATGSLTSQPGFSFRDALANREASERFTFLARCGGKTGSYNVRFLASSWFCGYNYADSLDYNVNLEFEIDSLGILPNLITVNDDGMNDYFSLEDISPKETCANQFDFVEIYNRWGQRVFYSTNRDFQWKPGRDVEGVFFYGLNFKNKRFSSWISVVH